ncbi:unnamed protein product, partial [Ectocarpus sp. 12 AP-2014]
PPASISGGGSLLPSVSDLFSSTAGPDFLNAPGAGQDFIVKAMKKEKKKQTAAEATTDDPTANAAAAVAAAATAIAKRERDVAAGVGGTAVGVKKPKGGAAGPAGPPVDKRKAAGGKEKTSAKDKVKGQRLKGQSGIGSDFRTWKSDLEMTMRQQYD